MIPRKIFPNNRCYRYNINTKHYKEFPDEQTGKTQRVWNE